MEFVESSSWEHAFKSPIGHDDEGVAEYEYRCAEYEYEYEYEYDWGLQQNSVLEVVAATAYGHG